jgi:hypothetical protein
MFSRLLSLLFLAVIGCSSSSSSPAAPENGVNDVLKACQIRVGWQNATSTACNTCIGLAKAPRCPCSDREEAGKCSDQTTAKTNEPTCGDVDSCVSACHTDCACVETCYAGKATCKTLASAADGCVAEVCDPSCR